VEDVEMHGFRSRPQSVDWRDRRAFAMDPERDCNTSGVAIGQRVTPLGGFGESSWPGV
jgi:hypothetical protein